MLTVTPDATTVALTSSGGGYTATQHYQVMSKAEDGTISDVSTKVMWTADDPEVGFAGDAATVTAAGAYVLTAQYGGQSVSAHLTATLSDTVLGSGVSTGDQGNLDGTPDAAQKPVIVYPVAGALFPANVAPSVIHIQKSDPQQSLARIDLTSGAQLAYRYYAACEPSPNPTAFPNACLVSLRGALASQLARQLAGVSETEDVQVTVRLAAPGGAKLGASAPVAVAWSKVALSGGLYYWTTANGSTDTATMIARYNFDGDATAPQEYLKDTEAPSGQCVGCHAVSYDGSKLAFSIGGSVASQFSLYDVATKSPTAIQLVDRYAGMSTFSPGGRRVVTMSYGNLTLRTADAALGIVQDHLFSDVISEKKSHPFWSSSGNQFAFVSWIPATGIDESQTAGDLVQGAQIWIAGSDGTAMTSAPRLLVPRASGVTSYYPAISDDDQLVVFNQSTCGGTPNGGTWGLGPCDSYNDITATLYVVPVAGGTPVALTRANGGAAPKTTNSWPRWSPDHGTFRGKRLYWVAFSSRRPYGLVLPGSVDSSDTKPQLWFAAVAIDPAGAAPTADPSFAPIWLPGQNPNLTAPRGNHTPVWTSTVVLQ